MIGLEGKSALVTGAGLRRSQDKEFLLLGEAESRRHRLGEEIAAKRRCMRFDLSNRRPIWLRSREAWQCCEIVTNV